METDKSKVNTAINLAAKIAEQNINIKAAISNLKIITHSLCYNQKLEHDESIKKELNKIVAYLDLILIGEGHYNEIIEKCFETKNLPINFKRFVAELFYQINKRIQKLNSAESKIIEDICADYLDSDIITKEIYNSGILKDCSYSVIESCVFDAVEKTEYTY